MDDAWIFFINFVIFHTEMAQQLYKIIQKHFIFSTTVASESSQEKQNVKKNCFRL